MPAASAESKKRKRAAEAASTQQDPQGSTDAQLNLSPSASNEGEIEEAEEEEVFNGTREDRTKLHAAGRANRAAANNFSSLLCDKIREGQDCSDLTLPPIASVVPSSTVVANSQFGERWIYPDGRVVIPLLPHGEPTFEKVPANLSHDAKSRLCYEAIARWEYSGGPKYKWPLQLRPVEVPSALDEVFEGATVSGKQMNAAMNDDPHQRENPAFWESMKGRRLNKITNVETLKKLFKEGKVEEIFEMLNLEAGPGVYTAVGIKKSIVEVQYFGQTDDLSSRPGGHLVVIACGALTALFHKLAADCEEIYFFDVWRPSARLRSLPNYRAILPKTMSVIEGYYANSYGTYQRKEGFLAVRREHGLPASKVKGGNGTPCLEAPRSSKLDEDGEYKGAVLDSEYQPSLRRLRALQKALRKAVAEGDGSAAKKFFAQVRIASRSHAALIDGLFLSGIKIPRSRLLEGEKKWLDVWIPTHFGRAMVSQFGEQDHYILKFREGVQSLLSLSEADRELFGDAGIVGTSAADPSKEVLWEQAYFLEQNDGPTRKFWQRRIASLPSGRARGLAYDSKIQEIKGRHKVGFEKLPLLCQQAEDGCGRITSYPCVSLPGHPSLALTRGTRSRATQQLAQVAQINNPKDALRGGGVPWRINLASDTPIELLPQPRGSDWAPMPPKVLEYDWHMVPGFLAAYEGLRAFHNEASPSTSSALAFPVPAFPPLGLGNLSSQELPQPSSKRQKLHDALLGPPDKGIWVVALKQQDAAAHKVAAKLGLAGARTMKDVLRHRKEYEASLTATERKMVEKLLKAWNSEGKRDRKSRG